VSDLDAQFKNLVNERRIPKMFGVEAYENHFILHRKWLPDKQVVVSKESAGRYFGAPIMLRDTDHFSSVKPTNREHPAHQLLIDFYERHFGKASQTTLKSNLTDGGWPPNNVVELLRSLDGTPVTPALVPIQLIRAVAEACSDRAGSSMVVQQAEGWLLEAGEIKPGVMLRLDPQFLPDVRDDPLNYWLQTFTRAATRGARVLVALLAAMPATVTGSQRDLIARALNAAKSGLGESIIEKT
jgi:hypothetical protein